MGPTKAGLLAALFLTVGLLGGALAVNIDSIYLFYLTFGVLQGIGLGFGYIGSRFTLLLNGSQTNQDWLLESSLCPLLWAHYWLLS